MFRRWRRRALVQPAPAAPPIMPSTELTGEQVFDLLNNRLGDLIGSHGQWTLVRRTDDDTDRIFHAMLTHQIAAELTRDVLAEQGRMHGIGGREPDPSEWTPAPLLVAPQPLAITTGEPEPPAESEPVAEHESAARDAA
jgi:hypothetical protein